MKEDLRLLQIRLTPPSFAKISPTCQNNPLPAQIAFKFKKRRQQFIRTHNETLPAALWDRPR
jgi:hypothetical protein